MLGHQPLMALRRCGLRPEWVTVETDKQMFPRGWERDWPVETVGRPQLLIESSDSAERLDLRCLIGVNVTVHGTDRGRVLEVFEAAKVHNAKRVIAHVYAPNYLDLVEILDTDNVLNWS